MRLLAIDTTSEYGGTAVYDQKECLAMVLNSGPASRYAVTLFEMADRALAQAGMGFPEIELYAVSNGPGSFTGIRVGLAAAQGWATAFRRSVKGVNLLEAMVECARPEGDWAVPVLDARRGEFFTGLYRKITDTAGPQSGFEAAGPGQLVRPERLQTMLDELSQGGQRRTFTGGSIAFLTRTHDLKARSLRESLHQDLLGVEVPGALLEAIAGVALRAHEQGGIPSPEELDACYIRRSDAEMNWQAPAPKAGN
ncbi:MAG TPA: tRNA (adenosine(37)-N6)-threonylcarbamoyltransferase complex dimerization subunit type 1 TsaB [Terriglobia bacterium]|nr:tRNA (adenosine(37)-N6)-threonylcarbamoyltransferase complex dimerization subunit type 1 TsaB [Terriglobia bacterium]